jgi:hypothetical protein
MRKPVRFGKPRQQKPTIAVQIEEFRLRTQIRSRGTDG